MTISRRLPAYVASIALALSLLATVLYGLQGGFGAGRGAFDQVLFILGLPWVLAPSPFPPTAPDILWLVCLPLVSNLLCAAVIALFLRSAKSRR